MSKYIFNNDAEILEFLEQLREKSIQIWAEGEKIRYRSKNGQLAPEILGTLKMAKGQILDFLRMVEKNVIPLTAIQTAYVVGQTAGCELGNVNAHYYIEYTIESLNVERLEQMINLVISKNDVLRLIVTHDLMVSLQRLRLPQAVTIPLVVMFRYIPTLRIEYRMIRNTMDIRGISDTAWKQIIHPLATIEYILIPLLMRCLKVTDELAASGTTRGLELEEKRYALNSVRFSWKEYAVTALGIVFLALLLFLDYTSIGEIIIWRV